MFGSVCKNPDTKCLLIFCKLVHYFSFSNADIFVLESSGLRGPWGEPPIVLWVWEAESGEKYGFGIDILLNFLL